MRALPGVVAITYAPEKDHFLLTYHHQRLPLPHIMRAVWQAGQQSGREFQAEIVEDTSPASAG